MVDIGVIVRRLWVYSNLNIADGLDYDLSRVNVQVAVTSHAPTLSITRPKRRMLRSRLKATDNGNPDFEPFTGPFRFALNLMICLSQIFPRRVSTSFEVDE